MHDFSRPYFYHLEKKTASSTLAVTANELRAFLRLDDMAPEAFLIESLQAATELLEYKAGVSLLSQEYEIQTLLHGEQKFSPVRTPILEIITLKISDLNLNENDFRLTAREILFHGSQSGEMTLRYRAGANSAQEIPVYLKRVLLQIAGLFYDTRSPSLSDEIITEAERLLTPYKTFRI